MKLSEAANWAEIVSALGLVMSLIYVGIQVTDNTSAMRSETAINNTLATIRGTPGFGMYWSLRRELFYPEYQSFVERLMFESEGVPNPTYKR